jgi:hypothetical protein
MHDLPRKLTREAKRIMWAETSLAQQKREFANWQEIDSNRPEMSWPDELDVRKAMDAQRDAIHNYQPGRKSK